MKPFNIMFGDELKQFYWEHFERYRSILLLDKEKVEDTNNYEDL